MLEQDSNGNSNTNYQQSANANAMGQYMQCQNYGGFKDSASNMPSNNLLMTTGNYSPNSSNYTYNYDSATSFDNLTRKSIDMKNQLDEQLLTKVSQMTLDRVVNNKIAEKQRELNTVTAAAAAAAAAVAAAKDPNRSCHSLLREEFYWNDFYLYFFVLVCVVGWLRVWIEIRLCEFLKQLQNVIFSVFFSFFLFILIRFLFSQLCRK